MAAIRKHLTYANVMSTIAVFLLLGGASAVGAKRIGAKQLKAGSVTAAKLKRNAVRTAKIRNGAVTGAKIADGAVSGTDVADASVGGADINPAGTPFSRVTDRIRGTAEVPFTGFFPLDNPTYVQPSGRTDLYVGAMDVRFAATCVPPRQAVAYLFLDPENPGAPTVYESVGAATVSDNTAGALTQHVEFTAFAVGLGSAMQSLAPTSDQTHRFVLQLIGASCGLGTGVSASNVSIDVIGTR